MAAIRSGSRFEGGGDAPQVMEGGHQPCRGGGLPEPAGVFPAALPVRFELEIQVGRAQLSGFGKEADPVVFAPREPPAFAPPANGNDQARQQRLRQVPENRSHVGQTRRFEGVEPQLDQIERPGLGSGGVEAGAEVRHRPPGDGERERRSEMRGQQGFDRFRLVGATCTRNSTDRQRRLPGRAECAARGTMTASSSGGIPGSAGRPARCLGRASRCFR